MGDEGGRESIGRSFCCSAEGHVGWVPICEPCVDKQDLESSPSGRSLLATGAAILGLFVIPVSRRIMGKSWLNWGRPPRAPPTPPPPPPPAQQRPPTPPPPPPLPDPPPEHRDSKPFLKYFIIGVLVAFRAYQYHFKAFLDNNEKPP